MRDRKLDRTELRVLGDRLRLDRMQVKARGHDWDVADILAVVEKFNDDLI